MLISFTEDEYYRLHSLASERLSARSSDGSVNLKRSSDSDFTINLTGIMGEVAFAKCFDINLEPVFCLLKDSGVDFTLRNYQFQIKTLSSNFPVKYLYVPAHQRKMSCHAYVLVVKEGLLDYTVRGYCTSKDFYAYGRVLEELPFPGFGITWDTSNPICKPISKLLSWYKNTPMERHA